MYRLTRLAPVVVPALLLVAAPALADLKTRDRTQFHFEGMLGHMVSLFGGKAAKEGVESKTAVKGNRKATFNDATGRIIDLSEEKVYDLDMKKKTYTVTTFDELRRRMREQADQAKQQAQKEEPSQQKEAQKPQKEYEVDFDVKDTGQKKQIAGYDTHQTIMTVTVREKGKTLEESGGLVMTNDIWLGPEIPQLKENAEFETRYWKQLEGPRMSTELPADQMAALVAMYPLISKASDRMAKDADKLKGTALDTLTTIESVMSADQLTQAKQQQQSQNTGGGISGMMMKKMVKKEEPKQRSTVMTTRHEILQVATSVDASDLAIPADFKEKK